MNKELKKIMTDLAAGHISKKEADLKIKKIKVKMDNKKILIRENKKVNAIGGK